MESQIESIDKQIAALRMSIFQRYQEKMLQIENQFLLEKERLQESISIEKDLLLKELDDRLALVKQFPSVLEADLVTLQDVDGDFDFRIEYAGSFRDHPHQLNLKKGKWKILILAKRIE